MSRVFEVVLGAENDNIFAVEADTYEVNSAGLLSFYNHGWTGGPVATFNVWNLVRDVEAITDGT